MKKEILKKLIATIILVVISLLSIFVLSPHFSSSKLYSEQIKILDDKKSTVLGITAGSTAVATALALVPDDATTPIANQILKISGYLVLVVGAIFLEKILLTLTAYISFTFLIPIGIGCIIAYIFTHLNLFRQLAIKLIAFGLIIFITIPTSIKISSLIEESNSSIKEATKIEEVVSEDKSIEEAEKDSGFWSKFKEKVSSVGDFAKDLLEKGKNAINNLIDAVATLIITSCVIPILTLIFFTWLIKIIFNVDLTKSFEKVKKKVKDEKNEKIIE